MDHKGIKDGLVLMYVLDGTLYPVGLTKEQAQLFLIAISALDTLHVMTSHPQGKAANLLEQKEAFEA